MTYENTAPRTGLIRRIGPYLAVAAAMIAITIGVMALSTKTGGNVSYDPVDAQRIDGARLTWPILIHLFTALPALAIGAFVLWRKKGDYRHRILGRTYAVLMMVTAIASFWIGRPGTGIGGSGYSFIHAFAVVTLFSIPLGVWTARHGMIDHHQRIMRSVYVGLIVAGAFTLIPGRLLGNLIF